LIDLFEDDVMTILTEAQKQQYQDAGYCMAEGLVSDAWLTELTQVTDAFIEESRSVSAANKRFDLESNHSPQMPRLRRLNAPLLTFMKRIGDLPAQGLLLTLPRICWAPMSNFTTQNLTLNGVAVARRLNGIKTSSFGPTRIMTC
jgi:hypothetical protein